MSQSICSSFQTLARRSWRLLDSGRRVGKQLLEETLTDLNTLELRKKHSTVVRVREFSKPREAVEGADWEWWFLGAPHFFGFRVQAKVLSVSSQQYEHLHYSRRRNGVEIIQCEQLLKRARSCSYPVTPVYCLYSSWRKIRPKRYWACPCVVYDRMLWGCSIVPAEVVLHLRHRRKRNHITDLLPFLRPWHCLVCCQAYGRLGLAQRIAKWWADVIAVIRETLPRPDIELPAETEAMDAMPEHVAALLHGEEISGDESLAGIMVVEAGDTGA